MFRKLLDEGMQRGPVLKDQVLMVFAGASDCVASVEL